MPLQPSNHTQPCAGFTVQKGDNTFADKPTAPVALASHPKNSKTGLFQGRVESRAEAESQNHAGVGGIDDSVIPESVRTKENTISRSADGSFRPARMDRPSITVTSGHR